VAIENLENHFIFFSFLFLNISLFGEISPMKSSRSLARSISLSLIAAHQPLLPTVAHHVFTGHDRLSHRRSSPDTDGRVTSCFQRTRSAFSSPFSTRYRWSHSMFSTDEIGICRPWTSIYMDSWSVSIAGGALLCVFSG
jgi:hypothetical protein